MSFLSSLRDWEYLAKKDPLWAILTHPAKKNGKWDLEAFFATGRHQIDATFARLAKLGCEPVDFQSAVDFGCGVGRLSRALAGRFAQVHGVDAAPSMIERGRQLNTAYSNLEFVLNQEPRLSRFADGSVSFVFSALVLQHISYPESLNYVREFLRILKPGGVAVFQTPTLDRTPRLWRFAVQSAQRIVRAAHLPLHGLYMDMNVIPTAEIEATITRHGCRLIESFNTNRQKEGPDGELVALQAPLVERMVSERFTVQKPA
jgi:SAM-dependent methyltransferase